jgi:UDP-glucose 4-epimerase
VAVEREPLRKDSAASGHEVMVFDSRLFGHRDMMHWNASVEVDISDAVPLAYWFDAVMHFARPLLILRI